MRPLPLGVENVDSRVAFGPLIFRRCHRSFGSPSDTPREMVASAGRSRRAIALHGRQYLALPRASNSLPHVAHTLTMIHPCVSGARFSTRR